MTKTFFAALAICLALAPAAAADPFKVKVDETVTLNLTWPLFDGGARYGDRKSRLARAETAELQERLLRRNVETAVKTALVSLTVARDALRVAEDGVEAARKNSEETEILYRQGLARALELTDANQKRFDAESALASARLTLAQAYLDLRFSLGMWPINDEGASAQGAKQ